MIPGGPVPHNPATLLAGPGALAALEEMRAAGVIALHDEDAAYAKETETLRGYGRNVSAGLDKVAVTAAFKEFGRSCICEPPRCEDGLKFV